MLLWPSWKSCEHLLTPLFALPSGFLQATAVTVLQDSNAFKMVLAGQSPEVAMSAAMAAIQFCEWLVAGRHSLPPHYPHTLPSPGRMLPALHPRLTHNPTSLPIRLLAVVLLPMQTTTSRS